METLTLGKALANLKRNIPLLLSAAGALCLFVSPAWISMLLVAGIFCLVAVFALLEPLGIPASGRGQGRLCALGAALLGLVGLGTFLDTWAPSRLLAGLAARLHLPGPVLLWLLGLTGFAVGFYAMNTLARWAVRWAAWRLPESRPEKMGENLRKNWFFPLSALAFFALNTNFTPEYQATLPAAVLAACLGATQLPKDLGQKPGASLLSALTAAGICWSGRVTFCQQLALQPELTEAAALLEGLSLAAAAAGFGFVYVCLLVFWGILGKLLEQTGLFREISRREAAVYGCLLALSVLLMIVSFARSDAFYGTVHDCDVIYTSDSPSIVKENAYLYLAHIENDLRQPLFSVFAAPFLGLPYLLGRPFSPAVQAMALSAAQLALLFLANLLLARLLKLTEGKRMCLMTLICCTYTHLLFTLMIEQYIVAYFWLMLFLNLAAEGKSGKEFALWAAGGTLLTSAAVLPLLPGKSPVKQFRDWFTQAVVWGVEFVLLMLAFGRLELICRLVSGVSLFTEFTGQSVTVMDKLCQYTAFVASCFLAPEALVTTPLYGGDYLSWQLAPMTDISLPGLALLVLALVSALVNRQKTSSRIAAGWILFSLVMLLGLGWGTRENGLILYALYFGWAFLALLVQLVEWLEARLRTRLLFPAVTLGCAAALLAVNIPGILALLGFAVTYYPI